MRSLRSFSEAGVAIYMMYTISPRFFIISICALPFFIYINYYRKKACEDYEKNNWGSKRKTSPYDIISQVVDGYQTVKVIFFIISSIK
jgi:hypothetical protein